MKPSAVLGYRIGAVLGVLFLIFLALPQQKQALSSGPANVGHEGLACEQCHVPAPGTTRQQVQADIRYWLGQRSSPVDFQHYTVDNEVCTTCHDNPKDAHPPYRFNEPRFAAARDQIAPQYCVSCHQQHTGERVTIQPTFCKACHAQMTVDKDPLDVPHAQLVASNNWSSCLICHDYHGNHIMDLKTSVKSLPPPVVVTRYFNGGNSPYVQKHYPTHVKAVQK